MVLYFWTFWNSVDAKNTKREEDVKEQRGNDAILEHV